jgi:uncharacterized membrane protein HdeD (DUF308 family)
MAYQPRKRVDLTRLPVAARYALALGVVALVVGLVLVVAPTAARPARWYTVLVTVGAVVALVAGVAWVVVRVLATIGRGRRRSR